MHPKKIILSRTDNMGDVILSLPVAGMLKKMFPEVKIAFIGKKYTEPIIRSSKFIDEFIDKETLEHCVPNADAIVFLYPDKIIAKWAKKVKIPLRIGTSHRWWHWLYCNECIGFSRRKSNLHEAQLNMKLLEPFGLTRTVPLEEIEGLYGMQSDLVSSPEFLKQIIVKKSKKVILHPKSKGSAREWDLENYYQIAKLLPTDQYDIFVTGSESEGQSIVNTYPEIFHLKNVTNLAGKLTLNELINCIGESDVLVACSTGPLHIAAAMKKKAIGIYPNLKPMHPGRWKPIGENAETLVFNKPDCTDCKKTPTQCACIKSITVEEVRKSIMGF